MKALLIDPFLGQITEVDWDGSMGHMYKLLGAGCSCVEAHPCVKLKGRDMVYVDQEGHFHPAYLGPEKSAVAVGRFNMVGRSEWFVGRGLVIGHTEDGDETSAQTTLKQLKRLITYLRGK